ncbi:class I SAM-dependent methyltransferase [Flammeovirgaceae bacterium SG7u.111]|nr:class I SAM-dependent methyltransferase [Flammeovirgaceae bacterium SG7u.132]WPO38619.1 class I SAM-dependent methyltransferase [Flammeovirgaceae bacterium SG7u.111]
MKEHWDNRYSSKEYAYGEAPNEYFKEQLLQLEPGKILLPSEGEGRNAVFAAKIGWEVTAFDISKVGKAKAEALAQKQGVSIDYHLAEFSKISFEEGSFDAIGIVFAHFPPHLQATYYKTLSTYLKKGGALIAEVFSKNQLTYQAANEYAGGPKNIDMLFSTEEVVQLFPDLEFVTLEEKEVALHEGIYHDGTSSVIRVLGKKK